MRQAILSLMMIGTLLGRQHASRGKDLSPIDEYIQAAAATSMTPKHSLGSLYDTSGPLANNASDVRAGAVGDVITVVVQDRASALSKGVVNSTRKSKAQYGVSAAYGLTKSPLANLAGATGDRELQGQGETSRENALSTTLAARITHILPNGNLIIEGSKSVTVNSESQIVRVRGIARRADISPANAIVSEKLSDLEIRIDGKGVVSDSVKRPFVLYRILMGLLPF